MLAKVFNSKCFWWCFFIGLNKMSPPFIKYTNQMEISQSLYEISDLVRYVDITDKVYAIMYSKVIFRHIQEEKMCSFKQARMLYKQRFLWSLLLIFAFINLFFVRIFLSFQRCSLSFAFVSITESRVTNQIYIQMQINAKHTVQIINFNSQSQFSRKIRLVFN